jgi:hypothetical protein
MIPMNLNPRGSHELGLTLEHLNRTCSFCPVWNDGIQLSGIESRSLIGCRNPEDWQHSLAAPDGHLF